ncbi:MAG TPA: hypothetical protein VFF11_07320 [Candidatus Binatia bacterium]|nr:hypothetical protein [Candidatus Binatia bacterium]
MSLSLSVTETGWSLPFSICQFQAMDLSVSWPLVVAAWLAMNGAAIKQQRNAIVKSFGKNTGFDWMNPLGFVELSGSSKD